MLIYVAADGRKQVKKKKLNVKREKGGSRDPVETISFPTLGF